MFNLILISPSTYFYTQILKGFFWFFFIQDKTKLLAQVEAQESVICGLRAERKLWGQELAQQGTLEHCIFLTSSTKY